MENRPKIVVLPLQPHRGQEYNGIGLGIHFLLGNLLAVHTGFTEFWFGWRIKKLFPEIELLRSFNQGKGAVFPLADHAATEKIRFWVSGKYRQHKDDIMVSIKVNDFDMLDEYIWELRIDNPSDHLIGFSKQFLSLINDHVMAIPQGQFKKAVWHEKISFQGIDFLGSAVDATYEGMITGNDLILEWFEKAVLDSPDSYLINDLKGWALYKNKSYDKAVQSFSKAIDLNPQGLGALAGMMWCYISKKEKDMASKFCFMKADVREASREKANAFIEKKFINA
jgi:tetratricopeptide (TPR) repeat protein